MRGRCRSRAMVGGVSDRAAWWTTARGVGERLPVSSDITDRGTCQQFTHGVSPYPAHRALLLALHNGVTHGTKPPSHEDVAA